MTPSFLYKKTKAKVKCAKKARAKTKAKTDSESSAEKVHIPRRRKYLQAGVNGDGDASERLSLSSMIRRFLSVVLIFCVGLGSLLYIKRDDWGVTVFLKQFSSNISNGKNKNEAVPTPDPEKYALLVAQLKADRKLLSTLYLNSRNSQERERIIIQSSNLIEERLPEMMSCWLGHPWDFNGTATVPGEGKIACGYFVSVIMRDAGFKINRIRVAQQPSQNIIRTFVDTKKYYEVKTNTSYEHYLRHIKNKYEGIHIVGLDKHVAFIVIKNGEIRFIHSRGYHHVVDEDERQASALKNSKYRVISNISRNKNVIKKWLLGRSFNTGGSQANL